MKHDIVLTSNDPIFVKDIPDLFTKALHNIHIKNNFSGLKSFSYHGELKKYEEAIKLAILMGNLKQRCPSTLLPTPNATGAQSTHRSVVTIKDLTEFANKIGFNLIIQDPTPVKVSQAPAPITPVRGRFYVAPKDTDREPRWEKWRLMEQVELWQAIALSLNIEPSKVKYRNNSWMGSGLPFDEGDTFIDRLEVLRQHSTNRSYFPTPCTLNMNKWYFCCNRLNEFSAWCKHVNYDIPDELTKLALNVHAPAIEIMANNTIKMTPAVNVAVKIQGSSDWKEKARTLADEFFDKDTRMKCRRTLEGYAELVMESLQELEIHSSRGRIDNVNTVIREALSGKNWWAKKVK